MTDPAEPRALWPRLLARIVLGAILIPCLYVLGLGPVGWLFGYRTPMLQRSLNILYRPLEALPWQSVLLRPLSSYYTWWVNLPGGVYQRLEEHPERALWDHPTPTPVD